MFDIELILPATMLCLLVLAGLGALLVGLWGAVAGAIIGAGLGFAADALLLGAVGSRKKD